MKYANILVLFIRAHFSSFMIPSSPQAPSPTIQKTLHVCHFTRIFKLMNFSSVLNRGILVTKFLGTFFSFHSFWGIKNYFHQLSEHFWEVKNYVGFAQNKVAIFISFHQL